MAAIYQWLGSTEFVLTTPLYPVETQDAITFSVDADAFTFRLPPESEYQWSADFVGGEILDINIIGPTPESEYAFNLAFNGGYISDILLLGPTAESEYQISADFVGGRIEDKLITAYTPVEPIVFAVDAVAEDFDFGAL